MKFHRSLPRMISFIDHPLLLSVGFTIILVVPNCFTCIMQQMVIYFMHIPYVLGTRFFVMFCDTFSAFM